MAYPRGEVRGESAALLDGSGGIAHAALHPVAQPERPQPETVASASGYRTSRVSSATMRGSISRA
jgi:hypothetical protein